MTDGEAEGAASLSPPRFVTADEVHAALTCAEAADALEAALRDGLDPEAEVARTTLAAGRGELLVMPAAVGRRATVKVVGVGGTPRIQGLCVVFDARTLTPEAILDGVALTSLRTPATSLVAARRLAPPDARRLVVFGTGPQARAHAEALEAALSLDAATFLTRRSSAREVDRAVRTADVICCATTAREPLFAGDLVPAHALVIAVGSHEPDAREVDERLVGRATVVVESRRSALREAGDLVLAGVVPDELVTLAELVAGRPPPLDRPGLFKSTGMSWEDTVVAGAVLDALARSS